MGKQYEEREDEEIIDQILVINPFQQSVRWEDFREAVVKACPSLATRSWKSIRDRALLVIQRRKDAVAEELAASGIDVERTPLQVAVDEAIEMQEEEERKTEDKKKRKAGTMTPLEQGRAIRDAALGKMEEAEEGGSKAVTPPGSSGGSDSPLRKRHCSATDDYMSQRIKVDEARHQHELALRKLELDHTKHEAEEERKLRREELAAQKTKEDAMLKLITELVKNKSN